MIDITYMWNLKYDTNEPIYETEIDSQTQRTDLWLPREGGWGRDGLGVGDQQMQTSVYRMDKQQGNYIQYPVINHNGKEYEKYIYMYN